MTRATSIAGFDGSEAATAAVRFAKAFGAGTDDEIVAATVYGTMPYRVAVVPAGWTSGFTRVAVAFDGREASQTALRAASTIATRLGARLVLICVYDPAPYLWATGDEPSPALGDDPAQRAIFDREITLVVDGLPSVLATEVRTPPGSPGQTIVDAVQDDIDLLIMGSRGYGPVRSVLMGSVSTFVIDRAACPVLVVPRPADRTVGSPSATLDAERA
ncbi:MAG: universal stress protein [Solirubrobacterales bacterium]|nr:universal stress protein [Solirubrobacterales bacterium]